MSNSALKQTQTAIVTRLTDAVRAATFISLCTGGILDAVPQQKTYPYAVLEDPFETPDRTMGQGGHDITIVIAIYTQDGATSKQGQGRAGYSQGYEIADAVIGALVDPANGTPFTPITVAGHDVVDVDVISTESDREDDGVTRRTDVTINVILEDNP